MTKANTEQQLRDAKDEMVGVIAKEAHRLGELPRPDVYERVDFVDLAMRRLAAEEKTDAPTPAPAREPHDGAFRGEASAVAHIAPDGSVRSELTEHGRKLMAERPKKIRTKVPALRRSLRIVAACQFVAKWASFKQLLDECMTKPLPPGHTHKPCPGCGTSSTCQIREAALKEIVARAYAAHGDPLHDDEARTILEGKQPGPECAVDAADRLYLYRDKRERNRARRAG